MRRNCRNHSTKNIGIDLLTLGKDNTEVCKTSMKFSSDTSKKWKKN